MMFIVLLIVSIHIAILLHGMSDDSSMDMTDICGEHYQESGIDDYDYDDDNDDYDRNLLPDDSPFNQ